MYSMAIALCQRHAVQARKVLGHITPGNFKNHVPLDAFLDTNIRQNKEIENFLRES